MKGWNTTNCTMKITIHALNHTGYVRLHICPIEVGTMINHEK